MNKYTRALYAGREIVIISANENEDSAIFFMSAAGKIYSFSRHLEYIERADLTPARIDKHFNKMLAEGATLFIRGYAE